MSKSENSSCEQYVEPVVARTEADENARLCQYFRQTTVNLVNGPFVVVGLCNPKDSGVYLHVDRLTINNFLNIYAVHYTLLNPPINLSGATFQNGLATRLDCCNKSKGLYFSQDGVTPMPNDIPEVVSQAITPPMSTSIYELSGGYIVAPGTVYLIAITAQDVMSANFTVNIAWWEEA